MKSKQSVEGLERVAELSDAEAIKLRDDLNDYLGEIEGALSSDAREVRKSVKALRKEGKKEEANVLEQANEELVKAKAGIKEVTRIRRNLNKNPFIKERKKRAILVRAEDAEDKARTGLFELSQRSNKYFDEIKTLTGDDYDVSTLKKLDVQFNDLQQRYQAYQEANPEFGKYFDFTKDMKLETLLTHIVESKAHFDSLNKEIKKEVGLLKARGEDTALLEDRLKANALREEYIDKYLTEVIPQEAEIDQIVNKSKAVRDVQTLLRKQYTLQGKIVLNDVNRTLDISNARDLGMDIREEMELPKLANNIVAGQINTLIAKNERMLQGEGGDIQQFVRDVDEAIEKQREFVKKSKKTAIPMPAEAKGIGDELREIQGTAQQRLDKLKNSLSGVKGTITRYQNAMDKGLKQRGKTKGQLKKEREDLINRQTVVGRKIKANNSVISRYNNSGKYEKIPEVKARQELLFEEMKTLNKKVNSVTQRAAKAPTELYNPTKDAIGWQKAQTKAKLIQEEIDAIGEMLESIRQQLDYTVRPTPKAKSRRQAFKETGAAQSARALDLNATLQRLQESRGQIILNGARRQAKLIEQAENVDPEAVFEEISTRKTRIADRVVQLQEDSAGRGIEFIGGVPKIEEAARKIASIMLTKMIGEQGKVPNVSTLLERGSELKRMLDIDPNRVWSNGKRYSDYLETDIDQLSRQYLDTLGADLEIFRSFGSLHPFVKSQLVETEGGPNIAQRIHQEYEDARKAAAEKYSGKALEKELNKISNHAQQNTRTITALLERVRRTRGIPKDPTSWDFRFGKALLNLNVTRLMGNVVPASMMDPSRIIAMQGLESSFRHGFKGLTDSLPSVMQNATKEEIHYAGAALDFLNSARLKELSDTLDNYADQTGLERGIQYAANMTGRVALFDYHNTYWKQVVGSMTIARTMNLLERIADGEQLAKRDVNWLAASGINNEFADRIWKQVVEGGGSNVNGTWFPNTEDWSDDLARLVFRAAIIRNTDDTIVTPGLERPLWMDASMFGRLIGQFRSFAASSLTKTMIRGAQDLKSGQLEVLISAAMAVGLGMVSWAVWSNLAGDKQSETMKNADFDRWMLEGVMRSGVLGPITEVLGVSQKIPALMNVASFGVGAASSRATSPYNQPLIDALGPTIGLGKDVTTLAKGITDPTEATYNAARRLIPYQNVFYARNLFTLGQEQLQEALE